MCRRLLFTIAILVYMINASVLAQETPDGSISGTLLMLDDKTPHVAVPVQMICDGKVIATTLSDAGGKYQFLNLQPGQYHLRCQVLGGYIYCGNDKSAATELRDARFLQVEQGKTMENIDLRFASFKKGTWKSYTQLDGLAGHRTWAIYCDLDGSMWFGDQGSGVTHYGRDGFVTFTTKNGLLYDIVNAIHQTPDGAIWFGTGTDAAVGDYGGVSRYDGKEFINFTTDDGLAGNSVQAIYRDTQGNLWFGTWGGGVSRYDGETFTNFTTRDGLVSDFVCAIHQASDGAMWFGTGVWWSGDTRGAGVSRYDGEKFTNFTTEDGLAHNTVTAINSTPDGVLWFGTNNGISSYDGIAFTNFTTNDGLADNWIHAIHCDSDGVLWFGTQLRGVSRYDGKTFVNFTTEDGLVSNVVISTICQSSDGILWFGSQMGGVTRYDRETFINFTTADGVTENFVWNICQASDGSMWLASGWGSCGAFRYDEKGFANFTTDDGLANNLIYDIHQDSDGVMWLGTHVGASRYDGKTFVNFTTEEGLANNRVIAINHDPDGALWFGTWDGLSRYDGKTFTNFTTEDGLAHNWVQVIHRDRNGIMWFGTNGGGISRYDGKEFINFTKDDGLAADFIWAIYEDIDGIMWFGLSSWDGNGKGLSRYDGREFVNFSTEDGLAHNVVRDIHRDSDGILWAATSCGVSGYDGVSWTSLDTRDGLLSNTVRAIHQDPEGYLWFATELGGLTRYRRSNIPPQVHIASVTADKTYDDLSSIPPFITGTRVTIKYSSIDLKTIPEKKQYRCRIQAFGKSLGKKEADSDWRKPTKEASSEFIFDEPGIYTFEVQAIDRDLNYSEPASLELTVISPFYLRAAFLVPTIGSGTIMIVTLVILSTALIKRRRQVHAYERMAVRELQDAREMQVSLLPEAAPLIEGMEIAGKSIPANTVGGDFFDYLTLVDGKMGIAIGDVSGKGLKAAMNAAMAVGILHDAATSEISCGSIMTRLNAHLYPLMEKRMFTAFSFAIIDQDAGVIQWSNAAQPIPIVKRGDRSSEADGDGQLPLGMAPDIEYTDYELELQLGDTVIFYTDGIIEAENEAEEMYGTERLINLVSSIDVSASAEDVIQAILDDVAQFAGSAEQYDDMTIVVVKKLEKQ